MEGVVPESGNIDTQIESSFAWYALSVRPRHEKIVCAQLKAKDEEVFLPLYVERHRWADRFKSVFLPLFPGYVFSRFDARRQGNVLSTWGLIDVVRCGRRPAPLDPGEIDSIRTASARSDTLSLEPYSGLIKGQPVTITEGPLSGLKGVFVEARKGLKLALSVELLNRSVLVEINSDSQNEDVPRKTLRSKKTLVANSLSC
jgi:transcription antitermination factor NusG